MFIGEAPGATEDNNGEPFIGRAGQKLDEILDSIGRDRSGVYVTNAVHCRPPDNRKPKKKEIEACKYWLRKEIKTVNPKFVLLLGGIACQSVLGLDGITSLRGKTIERSGVTYFPVFHPSFVLRDPRQESVFRNDLRRFFELVDGKPQTGRPRLNVTIVNNSDTMSRLYHALYNTSIAACDIETTSLRWWEEGQQIVSFQVATDKQEWVIPIHHAETNWDRPYVMLEKVLRIIQQQQKLKKLIVTGQNWKFDQSWLATFTGVDLACDFDTMLASHACDENQQHGLEEQAGRVFGAEPWDIPLEEKQGGTSLHKLSVYAGWDVYWTRALTAHWKKELSKDPILEKLFYALRIKSSNLLSRAERNGTYIDPKKIKDGKKYWEEKRATALSKLNKLCPTDRTYKDKKKKVVINGWNWGSPQQVAELLFDELGLTPLDKTGKGANSTSESVLLRLASQHPVPKLLLEYREAEKQLNTFIDSWLGKLDKNSCLHPSFKLHGTVTGRLSCEEPNLQQVPRDPRIRSLITAPEGWVFVEADYSQVELRIAAEMSRDPEMLMAFQTGQDVHTLTVQRIFGIMKPTSEERKKAKAINFGFIYGMWWRKFIIYARDNYGVEVSEREAKKTRKGFFQLYAGFPGWHKRQTRFAHENGYVRSLLGWKRRLPAIHEAPMDYEKLTPEQRESQRQAINSPVQSFASQMNEAAAAEIADSFDWNTELRVVSLTHDATSMWVRKDKLKAILPRVKKIMEHPKILDIMEVELSVPLIADFKVGPWGSGVEIKDMSRIPEIV